MKKFLQKNLLKIQPGNNAIAKNDLYANRDYYCEGQEVRKETSEESASVRKDNASVKTKKQKFTACYNMFF